MFKSFDHVPSFRTVLLASAALRVALILYSEWYDALPDTIVKYTDIDYRVFSDASSFLWNPSVEIQNIAKGPLGWTWLGDPYTRKTYRYTPLLAVILAPNEWLHSSFGKYLFAACDIFNGVLLHSMLLEILSWPVVTRTLKASASKRETKESAYSGTRTVTRASLATLYTSIHLFNPLVFTISTRGSSEAVLSTLVLLTLWCALEGKWDAAALGLGFATHWKIYPVIYGVSCLGVIGAGSEEGWRRLVNRKTVRFGVLSAGTFALLGIGCYVLWGFPFLYETYLYHLHRLDHRHNFSPYFYLTYLTYPPLSPSPRISDPPLPLWSKLVRSPLASFAPQMILSLGTGILFGRRKEDLAFAWFVQTSVFVVFNKVCTSQYFLWYLLFLPLVIPRLHIPFKWTCAYVGVWVGTQAIWLQAAYRLEFLGENVFLGLWARSLLWVVGNCWVLVGIMDGYDRA